MHAEILRDFFLGEASAAQLARDLRTAEDPTGPDARALRVAGLEGEMVVRPAHLVRALDATLARELQPRDLGVVAACLRARVGFLWDASSPDGALVAETLRAWSAPDVVASPRAMLAAQRWRLLAPRVDAA